MSNKKASTTFSEKSKKRTLVLLWVGGLMPLMLISSFLLFQPEDEMPSVEVLDNPPELLASIVFSDDAQTELGRYWKVNRSRAEYNEISPFIIDALISTEDERYIEHSGVDFKSLGRAVAKLGSAGGGSTITQQLAKLLFTLQQRELEREAKSKGESPRILSSRVGSLLGRINEKAQENIIATRLERRYTKEDIITMYLNQFDFLYNAVGIKNAARVYYNKTPRELGKEEAAMLVGMCKNPSLYNPHTYQVRDYRQRIAREKGLELEQVLDADVAISRAVDSLRAAKRRNQVLYQWLRNSRSGNPALRVTITKEEYNELIKKPVLTDYQLVDHKQGIAPYFREALRSELTSLFREKKPNGQLKYSKPNGEAWDIYRDGLKIYTTINANMQKHAENAVTKHLKEDLQPEFDKNNRNLRNYPFNNKLSDKQAKRILNSGKRISDRYRNAKASEKTDAQIEKEFKAPVPMRVFSWGGEIDTVMSPADSVKYYKSFLHAGLMSVEPSTGFVKAWVGGADIDHFAYDHVSSAKRQVGSTIKPFVYATAMSMQVIKPCTVIPGGSYCVDVEDGFGNVTSRWCPRGDAPAGETVAWALANSNNPGTVFVMSKMGGYAGPKTISKFMKNLNINIRPEDEVPSICLGPMDMSLFEMVPAQSMFVNQGIFISPTTILRVEDRNGNVIYSAQPESREALNQNIAYRMIKMMEGAINFGTGASLRGTWRPWGGISAPTAGKTGTTQNNSDGWFMGLTPDLVTGVWVGAEDRSVRFKSMEWGQGARMALPIYGYYMQKVYKDPKIKISQGAFSAPLNYNPSQFNCLSNEDGKQTQETDPFNF
jgi:penicillin-binding protein 1A